MSTRIGGIFLLLACIAMPIIIIDYVSTVALFTGGDDAPALAKVEFEKSVYESKARGWMIEVIAMALLATAALTLASRGSRVGWFLTATGAFFTAPMYAIMRGGYGRIFEQDVLNVELYQALSGVAAETFFIGQGIMMLGLGLVHFLEISHTPRPLPSWLLGFAGVVSTFSGTVFVLVHFDVVESYMWAGLSSLLAFPLTALLGARIAGNPA